MSSTNSETRTRILNAAWQALEAGDKTRMSDIAKAAGISRQAVYLHFETRADLLIAVTRHIDQVKDVNAQLAESRAATQGRARLRAFIAAWGGYIPEIYGVARALIALSATDEAAARAWADRVEAVRQGCEAAVRALDTDGRLAPVFDIDQGTDLLSGLLTVQTWEHLRRTRGWSQEAYIKGITAFAERALVA